MTPRKVTLERACAALAALVRDEYGEADSLAAIAKRSFLGITPEQVEALRILEHEIAHEGVDYDVDQPIGWLIRCSCGWHDTLMDPDAALAAFEYHEQEVAESGSTP